MTAAGGTSQLGGLRERLERELGEVAAQNARVKVHTPANMLERRFGVWLGELLCSVTVLVLLLKSSLWLVSSGAQLQDW